MFNKTHIKEIWPLQDLLMIFPELMKEACTTLNSEVWAQRRKILIDYWWGLYQGKGALSVSCFSIFNNM